MKIKTKSHLSKEFSSRLAAYSATATTALLATPTAHAAVINITGLSADLTFAHNSMHSQSFAAGPFAGSLLGAYLGSTGVVAIKGNLAKTASLAFRFNLGAPISAGAFAPGNHGLAFQLISGTHTSRLGAFLPSPNGASTGYVGFKAVQSGNTYYGWLRAKVSANVNGFPDEIALVDKNGDGIFGAYGLKSDGITAGETAPSSVPDQSCTAELSGLALLALGAFGVREQRRRRRQAAGN